jgi:uncharacterized protein YnzC (UPF0291/DUF896 family)
MNPEKIKRINELARKKKETGLNHHEREEHEALRKEYIEEYRENLKAMLDHIIIKERDGSQHPLKKKNQFPE